MHNSLHLLCQASPRLHTCSLVQFIGRGFEGDQLLSLQDNKGMLTIGTTIAVRVDAELASHCSTKQVTRLQRLSNHLRL